MAGGPTGKRTPLVRDKGTHRKNHPDGERRGDSPQKSTSVFDRSSGFSILIAITVSIDSPHQMVAETKFMYFKLLIFSPL